MTDATPALPELRPGTRYGRYRIRRQLAAGGMATVYVAQLDGAAGFGKLVALKRIHPHLAGEVEFVRMFLDEARLTSRISHSNVCAVTDFGEQDGTFYLAMELLHGESFAAVLRACLRASIPAVERARLFVKLLSDACEGLHAAHELRDDRGAAMEVVHRDVSPQNLFVTMDGVAKVLDFGIAKARHRLQDETVGQIKGKFAYMSPEQVRGQAVDRRTDIWALGVVAWEMLVGKRLFRRETEMETMFAVTSDEVTPPSQQVPGLAPEIDRVVLQALARDPAARHATARELGRELLRALAASAPVPSLHEVAERMTGLFPDADTKRMRVESTPPPSEVPVVMSGDAPLVALGTDPLAETRPASARDEQRLLAPERGSAGVGLAIGSSALALTGAAGLWWASQLPAPETAPSSSPVASVSAVTDAATLFPDAARAFPDAATIPDASLPSRRRTPVASAAEPAAPPALAIPAPEPPVAAPAVEGVGSVRLRSQLRIDELRIDCVARNPIATHSVPAGEHEIIVVPADGIERRRTIVVEPDRRLQLEVPWW